MTLPREFDSVDETFEGLKAGMRARGYGVGRNPDGAEQTVATTFLILDSYRDKIMELREELDLVSEQRDMIAGWNETLRNAAQTVLDKCGPITAGGWNDEWCQLRAALARESHAKGAQDA